MGCKFNFFLIYYKETSFLCKIIGYAESFVVLVLREQIGSIQGGRLSAWGLDGQGRSLDCQCRKLLQPFCGTF